MAGGSGHALLNSEAITEAIRLCTRRLQDIESDTGNDTRRRAPAGVRARVSQTTVYDTG